jgi:hypothetical protein
MLMIYEVSQIICGSFFRESNENLKKMRNGNYEKRNLIENWNCERNLFCPLNVRSERKSRL